MHTNGQTFLNSFATGGTVLACPCGVHFDQLTPGAFSLVRQFLEERTPRCIENLFGKNTFRHSFYVQLFDRNQVVSTNQVGRKFVLEIVSLIKNLLMNLLKLCDRFSSSVRSLYSAGDSTLSDTKSLSGRLVVLPVANFASVRERSERLDTNINAYRLAGCRQWFLRHAIAGDYREPLGTFTFRPNLFDSSFDGSGQFEFQISDQGQIELVTAKSVARQVVDYRVKRSRTVEAVDEKRLLECVQCEVAAFEISPLNPSDGFCWHCQRLLTIQTTKRVTDDPLGNMPGVTLTLDDFAGDSDAFLDAISGAMGESD